MSNRTNMQVLVNFPDAPEVRTLVADTLHTRFEQALQRIRGSMPARTGAFAGSFQMDVDGLDIHLRNPQRYAYYVRRTGAKTTVYGDLLGELRQAVNEVIDDLERDLPPALLSELKEFSDV